jgi:hypothetical protein
LCGAQLFWALQTVHRSVIMVTVNRARRTSLEERAPQDQGRPPGTRVGDLELLRHAVESGGAFPVPAGLVSSLQSAVGNRATTALLGRSRDRETVPPPRPVAVQRRKGLEQWANVKVKDRGKGIILEVPDDTQYVVKLNDTTETILEADVDLDDDVVSDEEQSEGEATSEESELESSTPSRQKLEEKIKGTKPEGSVKINQVLLRGSTIAQQHQELLFRYGSQSNQYLRLSRNNAEDTLQWGADSRAMNVIETWDDLSLDAAAVEGAFSRVRTQIPFYESGDCQAFAGLILQDLQLSNDYAPDSF